MSFLWAPLGLLLLGFAVVAPQLPAPMAGLHALTAASIGSMTLAVMTRAALGHSGREFAADGWTELICLTVVDGRRAAGGTLGGTRTLRAAASDLLCRLDRRLRSSRGRLRSNSPFSLDVL